MQVDDEVADYAAELTRRVVDVLGDNVVGVYLHGSATMDAFVRTRSDVDVLVVSNDAVARSARHQLADVLSESSLPCPGVGLELEIVQRAEMAHLSARMPFELILDSHEGHEPTVVHGEEREGDPDLIAHLAMARQSGVALVGPFPEQVFPEPDRELLLKHFAEDLAWAVEHGHTAYAVLNACRALRFARHGVLCSKLDGGTWALDNGVGNRATVEAAWRRQAGSDEDVDGADAAAFVEGVRAELAR
jgi:Domain of unknown function (DUF4111)/Nucleotidyltransferase domain